jgi:outer membrane protein OmpA-like peptidoglycan-associated protein
MNLKTVFICISMCCVLGVKAQFYVDSIPDFSMETAKSLAKKGRLVIVEDFEDFRYTNCAKAIAKELGFKIVDNPESGYCTFNYDILADIDTFNVFMNQKLVEKLGKNWRVKFDSSVLTCVGNFCCTTADLDSFFANEQFFKGYLFDHKSSLLNEAQKCIISNTLLDVLNTYPKFVFKIDGASSFDEKDVSGKLALNRALAIKQFLVSKGINPKRLIVTSSGTKRNIFKREPRDKYSFQRRNRSVTISFVSNDFQLNKR